MLEVFFITLIGVAAAQAAPGPNLIAVASAALGQGRRAGLLVTLGISTGMLVWAVAVAFGLGVLFTNYPLSLVVLKLVGGTYLMWLAFRAFRSAWRGNESIIGADTTHRSNVAYWERGLFVVLTNPKAALMWSAVATFLYGENLEPWQVVLFGPVGATSGFIIYGTYAVLFSTNSAKAVHKRFSRVIESIFCAAFGTFGGKLVWDGAQSIR